MALPPLGYRQRSVLRALRDHGGRWALHGTGWYWQSSAVTNQVLRTLSRRGLVEMAEGHHEFAPCWRITRTGREYLDRHDAEVREAARRRGSEG